VLAFTSAFGVVVAVLQTLREPPNAFVLPSPSLAFGSDRLRDSQPLPVSLAVFFDLNPGALRMLVQSSGS